MGLITMHLPYACDSLIVLTLCISGVVNAMEAGFTVEKFEDPTRERPVLIDWWYPVDGQPASRFDYGLGEGMVVESGEIEDGTFSLIVLSHGAMGAARNYSWIAEALARQGYVVAGVSHFGESYVYGPDTVDPAAVLRHWERPLDISAALSFIENQSIFSASIDMQHIGFPAEKDTSYT
jgi:predicted dienelactone hydrolase